jgi:hypothetical protein
MTKYLLQENAASKKAERAGYLKSTGKGMKLGRNGFYFIDNKVRFPVLVDWQYGNRIRQNKSNPLLV